MAIERCKTCRFSGEIEDPLMREMNPRFNLQCNRSGYAGATFFTNTTTLVLGSHHCMEYAVRPILQPAPGPIAPPILRGPKFQFHG